MAECIVGDIAPADNIPKEEKHRREEVSVTIYSTETLHKPHTEAKLSLLDPPVTFRENIALTES